MYELDVKPLFIANKYSHYVKLSNVNPTVITLLFRFVGQYSVMGNIKVPGQRPRVGVVKVYASKKKDCSEWRFHIGQWEPLVKFLDGNLIGPGLYKTIQHGILPARKVDIKLKPSWVLREEQKEASDFIVTPMENDCRTRLLSMPTGTGKTVTGVESTTRIGKAVMIIVLPKYIKKWIGDIEGMIEHRKGDLLVIQGLDSLMGVIDLAIDGELKAKYIICSLTTYLLYIKAYEDKGEAITEDGYHCMPDKLDETLGIGVKMIDEAHEHLHVIYKTLLYTNVEMVIALSATVISEDPVKKRVQSFMYPQSIRFTKIKMKKYIRVFSVEYFFKNEHLPRIRYFERGMTTYSHTAFEESVMKYKPLEANYIKMILDLVDIAHFDRDDFKKGDKVIVYAARVEFCTRIVEALKRKYPGYNVKRYCDKDSYDEAMASEIIVSNLIKAGTALDISNLLTVVMENSIRSPEANVQVLGRLRELKDGRKPGFFYLYCGQIKKHWDYHQQKQDLFQERAISIKDLRYPELV